MISVNCGSIKRAASYTLDNVIGCCCSTILRTCETLSICCGVCVSTGTNISACGISLAKVGVSKLELPANHQILAKTNVNAIDGNLYLFLGCVSSNNRCFPIFYSILDPPKRTTCSYATKRQISYDAVCIY